MYARLLTDKDLNELNTFLGGDKGDVDANRDILIGCFEVLKEQETATDADTTVVYLRKERLVGLVAARRVFYMHELRLEQGNTMSRLIMEMLYSYCMGIGKALMGDQPNPEALMKVPAEAQKMQHFHQEKGATQEDPGLIFVNKIR